MLNLKKIFTSPAQKNPENLKKITWLPKYKPYEHAPPRTLESVVNFDHRVHIMGFCGHKCYYRIDETYDKNLKAAGKIPYPITLTSYRQLEEMCIKSGGTKKTTELKHEVVPSSLDVTERKRIVAELQASAEAHYAQVLKSLELEKGR